MDVAEDDLLELLLKRKDAERQIRIASGNCPIERLLDDFLKIPRIPKNENLLEYWETKKDLFPELYSLSNIVHAAPMTQVSVERLFSSMKFILSDLRTNLSHDILDDILLVRSNKELLLEKEETFVQEKRRRVELTPQSDESVCSESTGV
ncbi:uncharacterized protein LOC122497881 isoform X2 [Leptopilina heterotoma]|uniref:uncharacterized protein LOC122497881 isoform X2 n=1 Tax=Leptopilina heterotoma TaxID=63436 RepID=UPI001CA90F7D|nr:uncharacterized protein LOC122497881 isoform X2 [Leptopilina heterotoma]